MNSIYIRLGVYAVIFNDNNEILLTKTQSGSKLIYNFPGGGVDSAEGFAEALRRECLEELGVEVSVSKYLYSSKQLYPHGDFPYSRMFNLYYVATPTTFDDIVALDCESIAWFKLTELPLEDMLDIDKEFVRFLCSNSLSI
jgi:mutator protein MutT